MNKTFIALLVFVTLPAMSQTKFTEYIQQSQVGEGHIILHQSERITELVNGKSASTTNQTVRIPSSDTLVTNIDTLKVTEGMNVQKIRINGYRIQVFSGGNSRQAKQLALSMGNRVKTYFSDLKVYTHFQSPHWICRVGDFKTYEEANEVFQKLKETGNFQEAVIVKSKVNAYVF